MPEYTAAAVLAAVLVVAAELFWARTGIFARAQYWLTMLVVAGFQVLVDGLLTRLPDPIVGYSSTQISGLRVPFDIPIEDFAFGFALVTSTILAWIVSGRDKEPEATDGQLG